MVHVKDDDGISVCRDSYWTSPSRASCSPAKPHPQPCSSVFKTLAKGLRPHCEERKVSLSHLTAPVLGVGCLFFNNVFFPLSKFSRAARIPENTHTGNNMASLLFSNNR